MFVRIINTYFFMCKLLLISYRKFKLLILTEKERGEEYARKGEQERTILMK